MYTQKPVNLFTANIEIQICRNKKNKAREKSTVLTIYWRFLIRHDPLLSPKQIVRMQLAVHVNVLL